jgi:hypothetical protein
MGQSGRQLAFEPDEDVQKMAEAYAQDAVDYADRAGIKLDWTVGSIVKVETILDRLYKKKSQENPSPEQVLKFVKMFGSYIGETYRRSRNHNARWGIVSFDGERFVGMIPAIEEDYSGRGAASRIVSTMAMRTMSGTITSWACRIDGEPMLYGLIL